MKKITIYFIFFLFVFNISCSNENIVEVKEKNIGSMQISFDKSNAPKDVTEVVVFLTRKDFETKKYSLELQTSSSAKITIENLAIGLWHLTIHALDSFGNILYSGETNVDIQSNIIIPVNLQLNPTTGGIELTVTWNNSNDNLVAYYPFCGNADDYSSYNNHGIVYGAKLTEDRFGNSNAAYYFDGIDDYIRIPDDNSLTPSNQKLTLAVWIKTLGPNNKVILYKGNKMNNREYALGFSSKTMEAGFSIFDHGIGEQGQRDIGSIEELKNNEWYFIVGVWNGNEMKIYLNGNLTNSKTVDATIENYNSDLFIGTYGGDITKYAFKGVIDDIRIYNYVLTDNEIFELYNETVTNWNDYVNNPVITGNEKYPNAVHSIIFNDKNIYAMYFAGHSSQGSDIYLALSQDGLTWQKYGDSPILKKGSTGSWDDRNVTPGAILKIHNKYFMYYNGRSSAEYVSSPWHIGLAISNDGINWKKYPTPVISGDTNSWDLKIATSNIIKVDGKYYMYYTGKTELNDHKIGLAISEDGIHWKKYKNNPILSPTENWEGSGIYYPSIIRENNLLKMVYQNSYNNHISGFGMAYSTDGINWTKEKSNPIFTENDTKNNYPMILYPNFQKFNNEYIIYYTGKNPSTNQYSINIAIKKN